MTRISIRTVSLLSLVALGFGLHGGVVFALPADGLQEANAEALSPTALHLKTGAIELDAAASLHRQPAEASRVPAGHYVVQLDGPLTPERLAILEASGVRIGQYLPSNSYIVSLPDGFDTAAALGGVPFVRWVGAFDSSWKLSPEIGQIVHTTDARIDLDNQGLLKLTVALFEGADLDAAVERIAAIPSVHIIDQTMSGDVGLIEITIPRASYAQLADHAAVQWVEESGELTLRNDTNSWILQSYQSGVRSIWNKGINGGSQVGGLIDSGVRQTHCSFTEVGKFVGYFGSTAAGSHGTHTAGTFLGDERPANGVGQRGMAYKARLAFSNLNLVTGTNLNSILTQNRNVGARVHSNSWGNDGTTSYTSDARDIDLFSFNNQDDLVLFAVTNLSGVVRTPENAKNCLAVAATTDNPATTHCSGGTSTTNDGRRKPEIMAPGCGTLSSSSSTTCGWTGFTGTSMACPAVAGSALLVRQYFTEGYYPTGAAVPANAFVPSGALMRATIINSGADMTGIAGFPSNQEGWGRVLLDNALYFTGESRRLLVLDDIRNAQGMTTGQSKSYTFSVIGSQHPVKVTLVWTEKEAALNANPAYINNLDLEVIAPGNTLYRGNVFAGGQSTTGGSADLRNNLEQVLRNAPPIGRYRVNVKATAVNTALPQGFALIVTGNVTLQQPPVLIEAEAR